MDQLEQLEACRICVTCYPLQEMDFINIFHKNEEFQQELDFIQGEIRQWQLKIQPDDGLPQRICANCFAKFCSIEAYRKECILAQERLIETLMQQSSLSTENTLQNDDTSQLKTINNSPLQLLNNYESPNVTLGSGANVLVSSVNLTQSDVSLNDFPVFDQQFAQYDNHPALIDASSTLLDSSIIAPESAQELGFLPSQNLFTFETAEPPSTGTLPLVETDTTSIMNDILDVRTDNDGDDVNNGQQSLMKQDDLEDMLKHSIIPTTTKLSQHQQQQQRTKINSALQNIKKEAGQGFINNNNVLKGGRIDYQSAPMLTFLNREDTNSDVECDDSDMNVRLKGLSYACHYCFCPETGPIDHLVFPNEDALSQHFFDIHDPNRPYTCPKCPQSYKTQLLRDNHVRLIHKITEIQTCNYCQKRLKGSIDVHQYNCQYVGDWECQQCKEKFPNTPLYRFRLHQRQHERTKQFKCRLCERTFMRKANLEAHQRMHKAEVQTAHTCNLCPANFADDYELKRHKYQQHNGEPPLKCKICHKGFSSNVFLQRHITQLHADNLKHEINVHCTEEGCDYVCKNEKALNDHIRHKHRLLSCEYCHEQFTRQKLTSHLRNIHRSEIDVELAGESDNYYKSQLLNNNNDITQISFNLLNTQQTQQQITDTSLATSAVPSCTTTPTLALTTASSSLSLTSSNISLNATTKDLTTASATALDTSPISTVSPLTCSLTNNCTSITTTTNTPNNNNNNNNVHVLDDNVDDVQHHQQICDMFATDPHDTNATSLALNGLVSNEHDDLSLHANDTANMFLVPSTTTSSATNDDDGHHHHHQLDQYFMASLIDTEQEIIVT